MPRLPNRAERAQISARLRDEAWRVAEREAVTDFLEALAAAWWVESDEPPLRIPEGARSPDDIHYRVRARADAGRGDLVADTGTGRLGKAAAELLVSEHAELLVLRRRCELLEADQADDEFVHKLHEVFRGRRPPAGVPAAALRDGVLANVRDLSTEIDHRDDRIRELEARYRELELTAGANLDVAAQTVAELQAALAQLLNAADPYVTGAADASSGQDMAAQSALAVACRAARQVLERRGEVGPYVAALADDLGLILGELDDQSRALAGLNGYDARFSPELIAAVGRVTALLQPEGVIGHQPPPVPEPIDGIVDGNEVRAATTVQIRGDTL